MILVMWILCINFANWEKENGVTNEQVRLMWESKWMKK